jgi:GDP-L-fucose synthase
MPRPDPSLLKGKRVWVTSYSDVVGTAILSRLWHEQCEIVLADASQLDLLRQDQVEGWFRRQKPDVVFMTDSPGSPLEGGGGPASILHRRLAMNINVLAAARGRRIHALVNLTATCASPSCRAGPADMADTSACSAQALAALAAVGLTSGYAHEHGCRFTTLLANGVYGSTSPPGVAATFRRLSEAASRGEREIRIDGTEALGCSLFHADDLADAAVFLSQNYDGQKPVRCLSGDHSSPAEVVALLAEMAGYAGRIVVSAPRRDSCDAWEHSIAIASLGWQPPVPLRERLRKLHDVWLRPAAT